MYKLHNILFSVLFIQQLAVFGQYNLQQLNDKIKPIHNQWPLGNYLWSSAKSNLAKDKSAINFEAIDNWMSVGPDGALSITNNGDYVAYGIHHSQDFRVIDTIVVQSINNSWKKAVVGSEAGIFSNDGKQYIFQKNDDLGFLQTGTDDVRWVKNISSFQSSTDCCFVAYQLKNEEKSAIVENLNTGKHFTFDKVASFVIDNSSNWFACYLEDKTLVILKLQAGEQYQFDSVSSFQFSENGSALLLEHNNSLDYVDLNSINLQTIWNNGDTSVHLAKYSIDKSGRQVVFTISKQFENSILYYKNGDEASRIVADENKEDIDKNLMIDNSASFSPDGRYIIFDLKPKITPLNQSQPLKVTIWSYNDSFTQSVQAGLIKQNNSYVAVVNISNGKIIQLEDKDVKLDFAGRIGIEGDYVLVTKKGENATDRFWKDNYKSDSNWVVSLKDGRRRLLRNVTKGSLFWFSPGGKYLIYSDAGNECNFYSYELSSSLERNISNGASNLCYKYAAQPDRPAGTAGVAAWLERDNGVFVYAQHDIWELDMSGKQRPINLTKGIGDKNGIVFTTMFSDRTLPTNTYTLHVSDTLLLKAFDERLKYSGYYQIELNNQMKLEKLFMGPFYFETSTGLQVADDGMRPLKANNKNLWVVRRQGANDAPNYYITSDFRLYKQLSNQQPQKKFNWYTASLCTYKSMDGKELQGLLYKPNNFNELKKYPVIVVSYGNHSCNLFQTTSPDYISYSVQPVMNPGLIVSNGYLVFLPELSLNKNKYGQSALDCIEGAVNYLKSLNFVDGDRIGCAFHSWSAKLGTYVLTHSHCFAASIISEGLVFANPIDVSLSNSENNSSNLKDIEIGFQYGNLWQHKASWIEQTAVLQADRVVSPLLLYCNSISNKTYENQTLQLFTSLRRLDKKVWWLQYENGSHILYRLDEKRDYTIRYLQFFDHYLKNAPAPSWMTNGLPYRLRGVESRYELYPASECGKDCRICKKWNEQYRRTPEMFTMPISEWKLDTDIDDGRWERKSKSNK